MDDSISCEGIRIGGVPKEQALETLAAQGIKTLVDVREPSEGAYKELEAKARELGLTYLHIPISKKRVDISQIDSFRDAVTNSGNAPIYAFSAGGKRPAGVLCFLACARWENQSSKSSTRPRTAAAPSTRSSP